MSPRRGQSPTTWPIALLAMLAVLVQALIPAAAMAYEARSGQSVVICTAQGAQTVTLDDTKPAPKGFAGLPCAQCVAASLATTLTPDIAVAPVLYGARIEAAPRAALTGVAMARAPPRPPGQGPPPPDRLTPSSARSGRWPTRVVMLSGLSPCQNPSAWA